MASNAAPNPVVDNMITKLLAVRNAKIGTVVRLPVDQMIQVILQARTIFMAQPMLVTPAAPVNICGDTHGQYYDLLRIFEIAGFPPDKNYVFMGDYVDRSEQSVETMMLLFCYKVKYPEKIWLLRGNHECASINRIYGFYDECKRRYNVKLWRTFADCFNCMPVCALVASRVLCMHGGLSPTLTDLDQINKIGRPTDVPDFGLLCDLLWSDPDPDVKGWAESDRGVSFVFGTGVIKSFCDRHGLDLICRAHQVVEDGYEFIAGRRLVTVFSAPNYCGEFDNAAGILVMKENLMCSFQVLKPA